MYSSNIFSNTSISLRMNRYLLIIGFLLLINQAIFNIDAAPKFKKNHVPQYYPPALHHHQQQHHENNIHHDNNHIPADEMMGHVEKCLLGCGECLKDELSEQNINDMDQDLSLTCANYCLDTKPETINGNVLFDQLFMGQDEFKNCFSDFLLRFDYMKKK